MGIFHRFLLFLFTLVSLAAGGALVVVAAKLLPERAWLEVLNQYVGRPETYAGLALYLLVGLVLLFSVFSRSKEREFRGEVTLAADVAGRVQVSTAAISDVAQRAARTVHGVRDVRTKLHVVHAKQGGEDGLRLSMQLVLGTEAPVKQVADEVHDVVLQELSALLGLENVELALGVSDITAAKLPHQPRVS
ncbi:alkaline shock response membrane anchor protein AmaP [uncultured Selenomonas sp.]|uniref:alkaline shock response membrane anchor protein AmaP n=1 Tax=uncultured Selenomonas sp. TaxID=159275 RepID=UPI0025ED8A80|nr:alkaline shock response membrane anchor protein AmaP [uncultured Selenomonas sp.]